MNDVPVMSPMDVGAQPRVRGSTPAAGGSPVRVLAIGGARDPALRTVVRALAAIGCDVACFDPGRFPHDLTASFSLGEDRVDAARRDAASRCGLDDADVVWRWRYPRPTLDAARLHPDDVAAARDECDALLDALLALAGAHARQVNPPAAALAAENKLLQLRLAVAHGLRIPGTLVSNDPDAIHAFLGRHAPAIHKSLRPHAWDEAGRFIDSFSARVSLADLPPAPLLQACPGIFQAFVPKAREIRVVVCGGLCLAIALASDDPHGSADWRADPAAHGRWRAHALPPAVESSLLRLMAALGLCFGSIDLVQTPDGEYVFLEVNQQGQFLWVEAECPALPVLDAFCRLLVEGEGFHLRARRFPPLSLDDFRCAGDGASDPPPLASVLL